MSAAAGNLASGGLDDARAALALGDWAAALALAEELSGETPTVEAERLDVVAEATWWLGRIDECIAAREQAYAGFVSAGELRRAGACAVRLSSHHRLKMHAAVGGGWLQRARRALEGDHDCVEYGFLALADASQIHRTGDLTTAIEKADGVLALARRLESTDLEADALNSLAWLHIDSGRRDEGLSLFDEAMLYVTEGRVGPYLTGKVYCSLITACVELGDLRRAAEWTEVTLRWSEAHPRTMWPGLCRVHRATLLQLGGDYQAAEAEARQACRELDGLNVANVAAGYLEIGEVRRLLGDLDGAEDAFTTAQTLCGEQAAGLALIRLAQGKLDAAQELIRRAVEAQEWNRLGRGKLMPAQVQIALAAGDLDSAEAAAAELEETAVTFHSPALEAAGLSARGRVLHAQGDDRAACRTLQAAIGQWERLGVPYEAAAVRVVLGRARQANGDEDGARQALAEAAEIFDRLGASLDSRLARDLTTEPKAPAGLTPREVEVLRLVASGETNRAIAEHLFVSERTVARHLSNIFAKIGAGSRTAATAFAFENGISG